jgi:hypothetical protein
MVRAAHSIATRNLNEGDLYIKFCDPDSGGTTDEAGWKVHT